MDTTTKPTVKLVGTDGNAFSVLGKCDRVAKRADWPKEKRDEFRAEAMSGDYDNLLRVVHEYFEVE